jgi:hypothetical protein
MWCLQLGKVLRCEWFKVRPRGCIREYRCASNFGNLSAAVSAVAGSLAATIDQLLGGTISFQARAAWMAAGQTEAETAMVKVDWVERVSGAAKKTQQESRMHHLLELQRQQATPLAWRPYV